MCIPVILFFFNVCFISLELCQYIYDFSSQLCVHRYEVMLTDNYEVIYTNMKLYAHMQFYTHTRIFIVINTYIHTCTYTHIHIYICTYTIYGKYVLVNAKNVFVFLSRIFIEIFLQLLFLFQKWSEAAGGVEGTDWKGKLWILFDLESWKEKEAIRVL